jgi:uncharacterized integral membrane protein
MRAAGKDGGAAVEGKAMQFLRTLFCLVLAVFLAIMAANNWSDVTLNLWGNLRLDIKIPLLIAVAFLAGFLPPFIVLRGRVWTLKRRLAVHSQAPAVLPNPPAPAEGDPMMRERA